MIKKKVQQNVVGTSMSMSSFQYIPISCLLMLSFIFTDNILRNKTDAKIGTLLTDGSSTNSCVSINPSLGVSYRLEKSFSSSSIKVHFKGKMCIFNI